VEAGGRPGRHQQPPTDVRAGQAGAQNHSLGGRNNPCTVRSSADRSLSSGLKLNQPRPRFEKTPLSSRVAFSRDAIIGTNRGLQDASQGEEAGEPPAKA
jgi:hypothetical protein